jgi:RNA polymerase sigma factor (sigma-70 family)
MYQNSAKRLRISRMHLHAPRGGSRAEGEHRARAWKEHAMRDDPSVISLVERVAEGDQQAWNEVVERYAPLVWAICTRYQLDRADIDDVGQTVWLLLIENVGRLRQAAALPGWLATTTRNECLRVLRSARRHELAALPPEDQLPPEQCDPVIEQELIRAERDAALRAAFAELPAGCRDLLSMLISDPPPSYAQVSTALDIPVGSIGPTRARCLDRLRRSSHLALVLDDQAHGIQVAEAGR